MLTEPKSDFILSMNHTGPQIYSWCGTSLDESLGRQMGGRLWKMLTGIDGQ